MPAAFADPLALQHRLFAALSAMFGRKVIDPMVTAADVDAASRLTTLQELGVLGRLEPGARARLEVAVAAGE
jgi:hypothetical protein